MEYHLCLKKNDKNLLHIVSAKDLNRSVYPGLVSLMTYKNEQAAFSGLEDLVKKFCKGFWSKGQNPDFSKFRAWVARQANEK